MIRQPVPRHTYNQIRAQIDERKRQALEAAKPRDRRKSKARRRASYRAYYQRNREQILAKKRAA